MPVPKLRHAFVAAMVAVALLAQGTRALAGTTGSITGVVLDQQTHAPVAGATVLAVSPSQTARATTDAAGHFTFLSLAPDTYSVTVEKEGYTTTTVPGIIVFADQTQTVTVSVTSVKVIARTTAHAAGALIKPGTTVDVYSVNAATASKVTGLGGGGSLDQAYSAIATVPGAYVPVGQAGWYQTIYIRGGDYDQVGYELDGVPVNRAFDNYPSSTASALGQQEVEVYTGGSPANSEGQGLSGYVNQVIKVGTYPGYANADLGIGWPQYYHKAAVEVAGATPDRRFSYYVGIGGYNQDHRFFDQNNGASIQSIAGTPIQPCAVVEQYIAPTAPTPGLYASCYSGGVFQDGTPGTSPSFWYLAPTIAGGATDFSDRENVVNFHFGIPHRDGMGRDDLQLLWQASDLKTFFADSANDYASPNFLSTITGAGLPCYIGLAGCLSVLSPTPLGLQFNGALGQQLTSAQLLAERSLVVPYAYPSSNGQVPLPGTARDNEDNGIGIVKLQYQRNFSSDAYLRIYGYTFYSNWFNYAPNLLWQYETFGDFSNYPVALLPTIAYDYELSTHTRGVSGTFTKQLSSKNLLSLQGSYTDASVLRDNNTEMVRAGLQMAVQVSSAAPFSGVCYDPNGTPTACAAFEGGAPQAVRLLDLYLGYNPVTGQFPALAASCGGAPCEWLVVENGMYATYNSVEPRFSSGSITDEWDPSDKLHINLGVRYDRYTYIPANTLSGPVRQFWLNAWNDTMCYNTANRLAGVRPLPTPVPGGATTAACQNAYGSTFAPATLSLTSVTQTFTVTQPRVGVTYSLNPLNVLRFSYGKYDQAPNSAFEQYNTLQQNLPKLFAQGLVQVASGKFVRGGFNFFAYGRTAPTYPIRPEVSYNTDLSWEHQFKGTDMSFKITPFYRTTQDQIEQFYLDLNTGFVSGLNVGKETVSGVEFQLQKGNFNQNGLSAIFSYTFTNGRIKFADIAPGASIVDTINNGILQYNAYTSTCATTPTAPGCSYKGTPALTSNGLAAAPCYTPAGTPDPACAAGDIANPYWNAQPQSFLDPNGSYWPYDLFPSTINAASYGTYITPNVATLVLNYKHDRLAVTPAFQFSAGNRYGYPLSTLGVDPAAGCTPLAQGPNTTRNPGTYTGGGSAYNALTCAGTIPIPNPDTGAFDGLGAFVNPSRLTMDMQVSYDLSQRVQAVLTMANIFDTCFGGTKAPWTTFPGVAQNKICGYGGTFDAINPIGNIYNPPGSTAGGINVATPIQQFQAHSYDPGFGSLPFNAFLDFKIKL